ncbi:MAG: hypothetical protein L0H79_12410 [Intrasporangium sp.]|uniref:hypothetical protein n=1 Tax=Intrasporangium sp. TaxID=1925024 RepID=UPI002648336E|nr:hypothetical protein [Intrasporangium sp.]MDN5796542.1 hypothetical protein [Intrasporangium sp.]
MDTAVGLVQAYLHVNGYFTVVEYPVLEAGRAGQVRTVTDLDILAYRFAGAGHDIVTSRGHQPLTRAAVAVDPMLGCASDRPDMIVGEVKEGRARLNAPLRDPAVLEVALTRFGCCPADHASDLTRQLLSRGHAMTPAGHAIRMVAFGDSPAEVRQGPWTTVPMRHVVQYLQQYLRDHWSVLRHAQVRDPAFAVLALLEKWGVQPTGHRAPDATEGF